MHHNNFHRLYMQTSKENSQATCNTSLQHFLSPGCCRITRDWPFNYDAGIFIQSEINIIIILWKTWKNSYSSDETRLAPPTLVTRCYVPHFHHYGDISIEIHQIKNVMKIMKMFSCTLGILFKLILGTSWVSTL